MNFNKILSILIILCLFAGFTSFEIKRKSSRAVLNIINAVEIEVESANKKSSEIICIPDIKTFTKDFSQTQSFKNLDISFEDAIKLGYLTEEFADNTLSNKNIKLKYTGEENPNCKFADIIINNESYRQKLLNSGFVPAQNDANFKKQLEKARKLNLVILNHKSNKFHTLNCKYGQIAHDAVLLPFKQLPKDAKPCKFCHIQQKNNVKTSKTPEVITYPLVISNGSIKMYLTDLTTKLKPDNKCSSLACKEILNQINNSETSIDMALYGWDNVPEIYNALKQAKSKGVKIRIAYDNSTNNYYPETINLLKLADVSSGDTPKILMHNKFIIFDNKRVVTGSMNFSKTGFSGFNSNCIIFINSQEIAQIYKQEFEQMAEGKFHNAKSSVEHKTVQLGKAKITPFFSPKDKIIVNNIVPLINNAKHYIFIPAFIITHEEFSNALINAHKRKVTVKIITDATNVSSSRSKIKILRNAGIPVKVENYAGKMHSKSIIIDDKYVLAGSMNFTKSGETKNDENFLIIEDERLARYYRGFFEYLWKKIPDKYLKSNPRPEGKSSIGSCSDGIDNDYDGKIDMADEGCR